MLAHNHGSDLTEIKLVSTGETHLTFARKQTPPRSGGGFQDVKSGTRQSGDGHEQCGIGRAARRAHRGPGNHACWHGRARVFEWYATTKAVLKAWFTREHREWNDYQLDAAANCVVEAIQIRKMQIECAGLSGEN
jgi:hypothetical protein